MLAGLLVTPTGSAKKVMTTSSLQQEQQNKTNHQHGTASEVASTIQREKQQNLARLFANHQQQKQQLLSMLQQSVAAQRQKVLRLLLEDAQQQEQQAIQSFQHSTMVFAPTVGAAANIAGCSPYQQQTAFAAPAASVNSLAMLADAATAQDPVLHPTRVSSSGMEIKSSSMRPKDKPLVRAMERKMPHGDGADVVRANRPVIVPHGTNIVEDDSDQESSASCTKSSKGKRKRASTADTKSTSQKKGKGYR
jgi:exonuclease VII large subunit